MCFAQQYRQPGIGMYRDFATLIVLGTSQGRTKNSNNTIEKQLHYTTAKLTVSSTTENK
jgi:hypothetical protein